MPTMTPPRTPGLAALAVVLGRRDVDDLPDAAYLAADPRVTLVPRYGPLRHVTRLEEALRAAREGRLRREGDLVVLLNWSGRPVGDATAIVNLNCDLFGDVTYAGWRWLEPTEPGHDELAGVA